MKKATPFGPVTRLLVQVFMILLVVVSVLPLYNVVSASLKSIDEYPTNPILLPLAPTSSNYQYAAFSGHLLRFTVNSLIYVPIGVVLYIVICVLAGYAFGILSWLLFTKLTGHTIGERPALFAGVILLLVGVQLV